MSSYLNFAIRNREQLKSYILRKMGSDLIVVEITDAQLDDCINDATEIFSKYANISQDFLLLNLDLYVQGQGIQLPNNVLGLFSIEQSGIGQMGNANQIFSIKHMMFGADALIPRGNSAWVGYEVAMQYVDFIKYMTGKGYDFEYNYYTKMLKLFPDPKTEVDHGYIIIGVNTIREEDNMMGEDWVKKYALAQAKILVGTVRSKYGNVQLLGGGNVVGEDLKTEGKEEAKELMEILQKSESPCFGFFVG